MDDETSKAKSSAAEIWAAKVLERKELAKQLRRKAYKDASIRRKADPKFAALKEMQKEQRRAARLQLKERQASAKENLASAVQKAKAEGKAVKDQGLLRLVFSAKWIESK